MPVMTDNNFSFLIVDDDVLSRYVNEKMIKCEFKEAVIHCVASGREALDFLDSSTKGCRNFPDYIFVDINMPLMDGFEFIENLQILNQGQHPTKIIVLSSSESDKDIKRAEELGVFGYLVKPLAPEWFRQIHQ